MKTRKRRAKQASDHDLYEWSPVREALAELKNGQGKPRRFMEKK